MALPDDYVLGHGEYEVADEKGAIRISLGAYQMLELIPTDLGDQFTHSGDEPATAFVRLTTAMDEHFVNRSVSAFLSEDAQRKIIMLLEHNLKTGAPVSGKDPHAPS